MSSTLLEVPAEPLPAAHWATANVHRLSRTSPSLLVLEPGQGQWSAALVSLVLCPVVFAVCVAAGADRLATAVFCLLPFLSATGFAVSSLLYDRFGTRARFDRDKRWVSVSGVRHGEGLSYPWEGVRAVQFCGPVKKIGLSAYQVNLVVGSDPLWRINLLSSGGKRQLRCIAEEIAEFLDVPLYVNAIAAQDRAGTKTQT